MKKFILVLCCIIIAGLFNSVSFAESFDDIFEFNTTRYERLAIEELKKSGIIDGYSDGTFGPNYPINRAEFLKIVMEAEEYEVGGENCFKDVKNGWFAPYVCSAVDLGIVSGYGDGTFRPEQNITFAEASKILSNAFGLLADSKYTDSWYEKYVVALEGRRAIPDSVTSFDHLMTRAEMAFSVNELVQGSKTFIPYYKDRLTYADIKALDNAGDFSLLKGLEPHNFYTDGEKVYIVAKPHTGVEELEGADPVLFTYLENNLDSKKTTRVFRDASGVYFLNGFGAEFRVGEKWSEYTDGFEIDMDSIEVLATEYSIEEIAEKYSAYGYGDFEYWEGWILLKDKNGLYNGLSDITGEVESPEKFEIYPCGGNVICGIDGENFYFTQPYGLFKKLKGFDLNTLEKVKDADGVEIPYLFKDKNNLYELRYDDVRIVGGADVADLKVLFYGDGVTSSSYYVDKFLYFSDDEEIWYCKVYHGCKSEIISGADPKTFDYKKHLKNL